MISIINGNYVVELPEYGAYQDIDPQTGKPFASEAAAQVWADAFLAAVAAQQAAQQQAEHDRLAAILHIEISADKTRAILGDTITLTATVKNALGQVVDMNDSFAIPVENERGEVRLIKQTTFTEGHATVMFKPSSSGYYCITEAGMRRLAFGLPTPIEIVVVE